MVVAEDDMMVGPCSRSRRLASCNMRSAALSPSRRRLATKPGVISWGVLATKPGVISLGRGLGGVTAIVVADRAEIPSRPMDDDDDGDVCAWWGSGKEARGYWVAPTGGDTVDKSGGA